MRMVDNEKIGKYLVERIGQKYGAVRQFGIAYLEACGLDANDAEIAKISNRLSQIKQGKKGIQLYDLPIFTELLEISCEQLLSAGACFSPQEKRVTNYSIAFSKSVEEWEAYIRHKDKPILNRDEYGKTVLDYALEYENYEFLKYLMDKGYIWFDNQKEREYALSFGAGTSIDYENVGKCSFLQTQLQTEDRLRRDLITLAVCHNDLEMLKRLRARENPQMYWRAHYVSRMHPEFDACDPNTIERIAKADSDVLEYFTCEFDITDSISYKDGNPRRHVFLYPHISQLLDRLIEVDSPFTERCLENAIRHNEDTYKKLCRFVEELKNDPYYAQKHMKELWVKHCREEILFSEETGVVSYRGAYTATGTQSVMHGLITNVAHTSKMSKRAEITSLTNQLNQLYDKIRLFREELPEEC